MADTKITALTALTGADPANDVIPIVDVSDTTMAASGTTKKISVNNILGASGTATLASATITGDLTVDTSTLKVDSATNNVSIGGLVNKVTGVSGSGTGLTIQASAGPTLGLWDTTDPSYFTNLAQVDANCYLYNNAAGALLFGVGNVEAMRLNSTGLGVGTTSPAQKVDVNGAVLATNVYLRSDDSDISWGAGVGSRPIIRGNQTNNTIKFYTASTDRMTLDASGNLLVGTTTNTNSSRVFARGTGGATTLAIQSSTGDTANPGLIVGKFDNDSTTSQILVRFTINNNAAGSGQINANGASQAAFGTFSDSRLKENIVSLPSQLANILSLRPVEFDYKDGSGHQIGFVAQEMQEVYSDSVGEQNGFLTVTGWSKTEARLVSAIKELAAKVQALEAKLA